MRVVIVGLVTALSLPPAGALEAKSKAAVCTGELGADYPCEWQRKLLVVQREFAANLEPVDETSTGSITRTDR